MSWSAETEGCPNSGAPFKPMEKHLIYTMMKNTLFVAMGLAAVIACSPNQSAAKEGGGAGHSHFIEIPATIEGIWKEIGNQKTKLNAVVANNKLADAHDHGYAIRDLVRSLPPRVPAESKGVAETVAAEVAKLATAVDKSSAAGSKKATETNVKQLIAAVDALEAQLKR